MWGGYITVPDSVPYVLNFVWTVPHTELIDSQGALAYQVDYQHQSGFNQQLALTIAAPGAKAPVVTVNQPLIEDEVVTVPQTCLQAPTCKPILNGNTTLVTGHEGVAQAAPSPRRPSGCACLARRFPGRATQTGKHGHQALVVLLRRIGSAGTPKRRLL